MENLIGLAVIAYFIYAFISAVLQKQQRPDSELPDDDTPWPHLENAAEPRPADRAPGESSRPDPRGPGPIFWPDLFGDPTRPGTPWGWPIEVPEQTAEPVRQETPKAPERTVTSEQPAASIAQAGEATTSTALAQAERSLLQRLAERESMADVIQRGTVTAEPMRTVRPSEQRAPLELTPASLRQAILYMEVLGPPRALRPYRPPIAGNADR